MQYSNSMGKLVNKKTFPFGGPILLGMAGFLLNLVAYYPGFMSPDSLDIFGQSISHSYRDWHPPAMAWFWSLLNNMHEGPQVMLAFQLGLLWISFYMLATSWFSSRRGCTFLFIGLLLAPFVQNMAGFIIKDAQMALSWLLAFSIIARAEYNKRPMTWPGAALSFLLILYGALVRINALPGALPLLYLWTGNRLKWAWSPALTGGVGFLALLVIVGCQFILNSSLKPEKQYPEYKLYLHDIAGIYMKTGKNYFPSFVNQHPGFDTGYLRSHYTTATLDDLYWNDEKKISFPPINDSTEPIIRRAWINSILSYPVTYLLNRWDGFLYFLRIKKRTWIVVFHAQVSPNNYGIRFKENSISRVFIKMIHAQSGMPYMRPWFWLIINCITLAAAFFVRQPVIRRIVFTLTTSSILYLLPEFFIFQVDTDFRYFYWNCLSIFISIYFLLLHLKFKSKKYDRSERTNDDMIQKRPLFLIFTLLL